MEIKLKCCSLYITGVQCAPNEFNIDLKDERLCDIIVELWDGGRQLYAFKITPETKLKEIL